MDTTQENENEVARIHGGAVQMDEGQWAPVSTVVVFQGLVGMSGEVHSVPCHDRKFKTKSEAFRASLDMGVEWLEKNVPMDF